MSGRGFLCPPGCLTSLSEGFSFAASAGLIAVIFKYCAGREATLTRPVGRSRRDGAAVHGGQGAARAVSRQGRGRLRLWRCRFPHCGHCLGLLFRDDFLFGAELTRVQAEAAGGYTGRHRIHPGTPSAKDRTHETREAAVREGLQGRFRQPAQSDGRDGIGAGRFRRESRQSPQAFRPVVICRRRHWHSDRQRPQDSASKRRAAAHRAPRSARDQKYRSQSLAHPELVLAARLHEVRQRITGRAPPVAACPPCWLCPRLAALALSSPSCCGSAFCSLPRVTPGAQHVLLGRDRA